MTRRPQQRFPDHQRPLSERCRLAPDADPTWRSDDANWREWTDVLPPAAGEVYEALRLAAQGRRRIQSQRALAEKVGVRDRAVRTILDEMEEEPLYFVRLERNHRGTITSVEVCDPPPVPDNVLDLLRRLNYMAPPAPGPDVQRALNYWCAKWKQTRGADYMVLRRDRGRMRDLVTAFGLDRLRKMMWWVLNPNNHEFEDDLIRRSDLSIGTFHARINRIAPAWRKAEERRAREERKEWLASLPWEERQRLEREEQAALLENHRRHSARAGRS